ncbi:MAG: hypothetical protein AAGJ82_10460, partial [Bacteroidota bacterium]
MPMTAEAIIFAINAAIRLGRNAQRAYAKSLTARRITLPLPDFSGTANAFTAQRFFDDPDEVSGGTQFLAKIETLADIHHRFGAGSGATFPTDAELKRYVRYFRHLSALLEQETTLNVTEGFNDNRINVDELVALLSIRQYIHDGARHTTPLQLVAGTIVELGIDYFNQVPGALNEQSATGRTLRHFLRAFDELPLSDNPALQQQTRYIVPQLFIAAAESITEFSTLIASDPAIQRFVEEAGRGIAKDLYGRLEAIQDSDYQEEAVRWGRLLLRSTVENAGHYVFASPQDFLGTNAGASALIQATATVLLDAILQDPDQLDLRAGFNAETLDRLLHSSFGVLAEHPYLIQGDQGFRQIVSGVSRALQSYHFRRPDLFPDLLRIVLEQTGQHLQLFWQPVHDGQALPPQGREGHQLFLTALQLILAELSRPVTDGTWRPRLSKSQLLFITEELLEEVVANPAWIEREVSGQPLLALVLRATLDGLDLIPKDERLQADVFRWLLELNLRTVAANELVLERVGWGTDEQEERILQQAITLVFAYTFEQRQTTVGDRYQLLADLLEFVLEIIISNYPDERGLLLVELILFRQPELDYSGGFNRELATSLLDVALDTLAAHPDLISERAALVEVVAGVADALDASSFQREDILLELVRLTLENTAINTGLILRTTSDEARFLLVTFIREILVALSYQEDNDTVWQPRLTPAEVLVIADALVNELIQHPEWIIRGQDGQSFFRDVLMALRRAFFELPPNVQFTNKEWTFLLSAALQAAATNEALLDELPFGDDPELRTVLERAFATVAQFVFREMQVSSAERLLRFAEIIEYVLEDILTQYPDDRGLQLTQLILFGEDDLDYRYGFDDELADVLLERAAYLLRQRPDLLTSQVVFQQLISGLASSLTRAGLRERGVLPELVGAVLEVTNQHPQLLVALVNGQHR